MIDTFLMSGPVGWLILLAFTILFAVSFAILFLKKPSWLSLVIFLFALIPVWIGYVESQNLEKAILETCFSPEVTSADFERMERASNAPFILGKYLAIPIAIVGLIDVALRYKRRKTESK